MSDKDKKKNDTYSLEILFDSIRLKQKVSGYRFSIDPLLLSYFAQPSPGDSIVDLGTGCGIIPILLKYRIPSLQIKGVEIQQALAEIAEDNIRENRMSKNIEIIHSDMKKIPDLIKPGTIDMVVTNPPYTKKKSGRINPDPEKAIARHELAITIDELLDVTSFLLKDQGEFVIIYPYKRLAELLAAMKKYRLNPEKRRIVFTKKNAAPKLVLLSGRKNGYHDCDISSPLHIYSNKLDSIPGFFQ